MSKFLFVADPLGSLKIAADTSLALAEAALGLGYGIDWCEPWQLGIFGTEVVVASPQPVRFISLDHVESEPPVKKLASLSEYAGVFVRKDPPFDEEYKNICWILAAQNKTPVYNSARSLLNYHEKALHLLAVSKGVLHDYDVAPSCVTASPDIALLFCEQQEQQAQQFLSVFPDAPEFQGAAFRFIVKPWLGFGGRDIEVFNSAREVHESMLAHATKHTTRFKLPADNEIENGARLLPERIIVQPFLPEIFTDGDRRVLVANGKVVCDFVRFPAAGKVASNLAQGGKAVLQPISPKQKAIAENLAEFLKEHDVSFAGIDMIGNKIGEINITSPTGIRTYEQLANCNVRTSAFEAILLQGPGRA